MLPFAAPPVTLEDLAGLILADVHRNARAPKGGTWTVLVVLRNGTRLYARDEATAVAYVRGILASKGAA